MTVLRANSDTDMKNLLFVCTGNTCRSPMAEAVFNSLCDGNKFHADSCGLYADGFSRISENACKALSEFGIDFDSTSKTITRELCEKAHYIIGISNRHAGALAVAFPEFENKIYSFPIDIPDPYGCDLDVYKECLDKITEGVKAILRELDK